MSEPTITTRVDHLGEMKAAISAATSAAQNAGILARDIRDYIEGTLTFWRQRAAYQSDQPNVTRPMSDGRGGTIDYAANAARAAAIREEKQRLADEAAYRADVERRAEAQAERESYVR
jgi:hypothetical protein